MSVNSSPRKMNAFIKDSQHSNRLAFSLQKFNVQNDFTDICFICDNGFKVFAHKLVFCTVSPQLKQMILGLPENLPRIIIHLPDVESRMLRLVCDFLYEGSLYIKHAEYPSFKNTLDILGIKISYLILHNPDTVIKQEPEMDVIQQGNLQSIPVSNQMTSGKQVVGAANEIPTRKIDQSNFSPHHQPVQQRTQCGISSNSNQLKTSRVPRPNNQSQPIVNNTTASPSLVREKPIESQQPQPLSATQLNKSDTNVALITEEDIASVLANGDLNSLTAKKLRECLEKKLGVDLSSQEALIDEVLRSVQETDDAGLSTMPAKSEMLADSGATSESVTMNESGVSSSNVKSKLKKNIYNFNKSDDERDEDFCPKKKVKRKNNKKK